MPELPDVETYRRRLKANVLRRTVRKVTVRDKRIVRGLSPAALARRLRGAKLVAPRRHGKHLLIGIEGDGWLTMHFGMSGDLMPWKTGDPEPRFTRVRIDLAGGRVLSYTNRRMLGHVGFAADARAFVAAQKLGPDALDRSLTAAAFRDAVVGARGAIKAALMDQEKIAGIGNIYSDEILFQAGIHPETRTDRLDRRQIARLFRTMRSVLRKAVAAGAGNEDFVERLPRGFLLPYRARGGRCPRCGGPVRAIKTGGRTAYFCPACQKR